jgi:hypothetical protein
MGLFSRKPQPAPQPARQLAAPLAAEKEIIVVATEHYTDLRRVPVGPVSGVTIQPEPTNPHDRNAVLVCWGGQRVGYLSATCRRHERGHIDLCCRASIQSTPL